MRMSCARQTLYAPGAPLGGACPAWLSLVGWQTGVARGRENQFRSNWSAKRGTLMDYE